MITNFLNLEWKQYFRSANWQKSVFLNIFLVLFGLYFAVCFLLIGIGGYFILKEQFPEQDPLVLANSFLLYAILGDLIFRYLMQKLPVMNIKPLLTLSIKKSKIVHFILIKSSFSFFNIMGLFFYIPFAVVLMVEGYEVSGVLGWLFTMIFLIQSANFLNFLINKNTIAFGTLIAILLGGYLVQYFEFFDLPGFIGTGFDFVYQNPTTVVVFAGFLAILYIVNYKQLRNEVYLDALISEKTKEVTASDLSFTEKLGDLAPFIKNDLRLMWRNKRTKSGIWMLALGLGYGLIFYTNPMYAEIDVLMVLVGIFSTGTFLINFGQFIPAWDSSYYKMLMSQNFKYERYLKSKFTIMSISVVLLFLLGIPYVYFGWEILAVHFAAMIYNIGVNTHVILYGGTFNRKKINLDEKAAFNFQGTGAVQWLIGFPLMFLPMGIFGLINWLVSFEIATITIAVLGFIGVALHKKLMASITKKYIKNKYVMIHAFNQEN
ncbi:MULTISPECIES: DUF5687 family protein [unclassified Polaribacter]|uniref:DUF5687 family protein n=1 Tax=unclassified Polaribacter TaxID=196858 RepID=UPI0011BFA219|nr:MULTISPECIES: DUF5687 family protein [unclassified Polaribacter]TXD50592.1 hypothetical protein ES043_15475 [Polaribacter sp. IC063]TXD61720.1 hypothetical protein ES044_04330 [Polaribacter sp. IC066]